MTIKTLLIALSVIGFLSLSLTSCSSEQDMGVGETGGPGTPDGYISPKQVLDSISFPQNDTVTNLNFPKD